MSCAVNPVADKVNDSADENSLTKKYLALGDSYTIGESIEESGRFPNQLVTNLKSEIILDLKTIARTGWTTKELLSAIESNKNNLSKYDVVTLLIGVNDEFRGGNIEDFETHLKTLVDKAIFYAKGSSSNVILISIPDYGVTKYGKRKNQNKEISKRIDSFNEKIKELANTNKVKYLDITEISRKLGDDAQYLAFDGLHPSKEQYSKWNEIILPEVRMILGL